MLFNVCSYYNANVVDMGTGVMWAEANLGAQFGYEYGYHFQWAETTGYTTINRDAENLLWLLRPLDYRYYKFDRSYDEWKNAAESTYCGYCECTSPDTLRSSSYDAAYAFSNGYFSIPSPEDFKNLVDNCTVELEKINEHSKEVIVVFKSNINGNELTFPAYADLWTNHVVESDLLCKNRSYYCGYEWNISMSGGFHMGFASTPKWHALNIRPVHRES